MAKLTVNVSPHIFSPIDTRYMMRGAIKALIPTICISIYFFRFKAIMLILASSLACILTEYFFQKIRHKPIRIRNSSAVLTGLLFALVLPPQVPLWMCFLGGVFAIAFGKEIFGGLGCNIFNPALLARAFLMAAFPVHLTTWTSPITLDAMTQATPLGLAKFGHIITPYPALFLGKVGGSLGETSAVMLLIGLGYLLYKKIIDYRISTAYLGTVIFLSLILYLISPARFSPPLFHVLSGGLVLGASFMATDPVTSPVTPKGRWVFGTGCGLMTMIIRTLGGLPEGVMYSILFMNALTPLINRMTRARRFGTN